MEDRLRYVVKLRAEMTTRVGSDPLTSMMRRNPPDEPASIALPIFDAIEIRKILQHEMPGWTIVVSREGTRGCPRYLKGEPTL